jgi:ribosomal protein L32
MRPGDVLWVTLCGQLVVETALDPADVTCKLCQRKIRQREPDLQVIEYVSAVATGKLRSFSPPPPVCDPQSGLPFVTPDTWTTIKNRHHWCSYCPTCSWFNEIEADHNASPWKKRHRLAKEHHRWPSVNACIEWYATIRADGFTVPTLGEALAKIGKLGTVIRSSGSDPRAQAEADDAHTVEQALAQCYQLESKRGLTRSERLYMLFQIARGQKPHVIAIDLRQNNPAVLGLTGPMVSGIAADGRWTVYEFLRTRKLVPRR